MIFKWIFHFYLFTLSILEITAPDTCPLGQCLGPQTLWVGTVLGSDSNGRKAGFLILIHNNLPCTVLSVDSDPQGRFLSVHVQIGTRDLIISNIYAPNSPTKQSFSELSTWLLRDPHLPHILVRDFNSTMHPIDDRSSPKHSCTPPDSNTQTLLASMIDLLHLHDIRRLRHPADREFTFYSNPHNFFFSPELTTSSAQTFLSHWYLKLTFKTLLYQTMHPSQ